MEPTTPSKLKPALIGGAALGVASAIPGLNCLNCLCCALVIGGGFLAGYLYLKNAPPTAQPPFGDGAVVGLMAGAVGAAIGTLIAIPFQVLSRRMGLGPPREEIEGMLAEADIPPELQEWIVSLAAGEFAAGSMLIMFAFNLVIYSIFALIGGLIAVAVFHRRPVPPPAPTF